MPESGEVRPERILATGTSCGKATPVDSQANQPGLPSLNRFWNRLMGGGVFCGIVTQAITELLLIPHEVRHQLGRIVIATGRDAMADFSDFIDDGIRHCRIHDRLRVIPGAPPGRGQTDPTGC